MKRSSMIGQWRGLLWLVDLFQTDTEASTSLEEDVTPCPQRRTVRFSDNPSPSASGELTEEGGWCGDHVISMWLSCDLHVIVMWSLCDCHVISMWLSCDLHVIVMWSLCDYHVISMWLSCDLHVIVMWSPSGYVMCLLQDWLAYLIISNWNRRD